MCKYKWKMISLLLAASVVLGACGAAGEEIKEQEENQQADMDSDEEADVEGSLSRPAGGEEEKDLKEEAQTSAGEQEKTEQPAREEQEEEQAAVGELEMKSGISIPQIEIASDHIPDTEAMKFVENMKAGWCLGNTLDSYNGSGNAGLASEESWGNPATTKEMITTVKNAGFKTIRIPVTWHNHLEKEDGSNSFTISSDWMNRVQEVVDYAYDNGMYVILNIHHDTAADVYYPDSAHYDQSEIYIRTVWEAVADRFKDYDEHLIFEGMNEPRLIGSGYEWNFQESSAECKDSVDCINRLNQVFVDAVRASGGNNAARYLMVPGYAASLAGVTTDLFVLPTDSAENKLIVSTHAYTPYNFALQSPTEGGSTDSFSAEGGQGRADIDYLVNSLYQKFVSQGIPVVMGEYGARNKNDNLQDRVNYYAYYIAAARAKGITCCVWDNGAFAGNGELFGILIRQKCVWAYPEVVNAIMAYA